MRPKPKSAKQVIAERVISDLGRRIAELREDRHLTQAQLAEMIGWSSKYQQRVERGVNLTMESISWVAHVLRVGIPDLMLPPASRARRGPGRPPRIPPTSSGPSRTPERKPPAGRAR